jgi:hypothetical protein
MAGVVPQARGQVLDRDDASRVPKRSPRRTPGPTDYAHLGEQSEFTINTMEIECSAWGVDEVLHGSLPTGN